MPDTVYDRHEQLIYISQYVRNVPYQISGRGGLPSDRQDAYRTAIEQFLPNHPFIRGTGFANDVFGAMVAAYQICELSAYRDDIAQLEDLSQGPFLWRACRSYFGGGETLLDGDMIGYILTSMWTDSLVENPSLEIRDRESGGVEVTIKMSGGSVTFLATLPLRFVQIIGPNSTVAVSGHVILGGFKRSGSFEIKSGVNLKCDELTVEEKLVRLNSGHIEIDANKVTQPPNLEITYGKAGQAESRRLTVKSRLAVSHPWSVIATAREGRDGELTDKWVTLIERCASRASAVGLPALKQNGSPFDGDASIGWIKLQYESEFPRLVNEIVAGGLGVLERMQASGATKFRLKVDFDWQELAKAVRWPNDSKVELGDLVRRLRGQ